MAAVAKRTVRRDVIVVLDRDDDNEVPGGDSRKSTIHPIAVANCCKSVDVMGNVFLVSSIATSSSSSLSSYGFVDVIVVNNVVVTYGAGLGVLLYRRRRNTVHKTGCVFHSISF